MRVHMLRRELVLRLPPAIRRFHCNAPMYAEDGTLLMDEAGNAVVCNATWVTKYPKYGLSFRMMSDPDFLAILAPGVPQ